MAKKSKENSKGFSKLSGDFRAQSESAEEELDLLQKQLKSQDRILKNLEEISERKRKNNELTKEDEKQLNRVKAKHDEISKAVEKQNSKVQKLNKSINDSNDSIRRSLSNFEEIDGALGSIQSLLRETSNSTLVGFDKQLNAAKVTIGSISEQLQNQNDLTEEQVEVIKRATKGYGSSISKIAQMNVALAKGKVDRVEYNQSIIRSIEEFENLKNSIDETTESGKLLKQQIEESYQGMLKFKKAADLSQKAIEASVFATDKLSNAIPGVGGELAKVFETGIKGGKGMTMALAALGAAAGAFAYKLGLVGNEIKIVAESQIKINDLQKNIDIAKTSIEGGLAPAGQKLAKGFERNFAAQRASLQFSFKSIRDIAQFQSESKTALFGDKLGSVGYAQDKLMQAGISAGTVAEQLKTSGAIMGKMPSAEIAADMAVFSKQMDIGGDTTAKVAKLFGATSNLSAKTAMNMQAAVASFAKNKGLNFSKIMENIASSADSVLTYTTKNTAQLQKNAIYAASIGVDQSKINQLGENMVLNYKDSIKAEMQLSSLLGESVDLSEVRARFAAGDETGALEALKAQGLDPNSMNAFQRQALMQALPGMSLSDLTNIATKTGTDIGDKGLGTMDQKKFSEEFLTRTQEALKNLDITNANISIKEKIRMTEFETELANAVQRGLADNIYNLNKDTAGIKQEEAIRDTQTGLGSAVSMLAGSLITTGLGKLVGKFGGNFFKGKIPTIPTPGPTSMTDIASKGAKVISSKTGKPLYGAAADAALKAGTATAGETALKTAGKEAIEIGAKTTAKTGLKVAGKGLVKAAIKKIPIIGAAAGILFAAQRVMAGDFSGAGLEVASGVAGTLPGLGTAASIGIDAALAAKDMGAFDSTETKPEVTTKPTKPEVTTKPTTTTVQPTKDNANKRNEVLASMAASVNSAGIITKGKNAGMSWADYKRTYNVTSAEEKSLGITSKMGATVTSAAAASSLQKASAEDKVSAYNKIIATNTAVTNERLAELNTNTKAILQLTRVMEQISVENYAKETGNKNINLKVDGKTIAVAVDRFNANNKGGASNAKR
jgi:hypothetical protein